jgi:hypothetical protein
MEDKAVKRRDGLKPKVTSGSAALMFSPKSGQDGPRTLNYTGWEPIVIEVKLEGVPTINSNIENEAGSDE